MTFAAFICLIVGLNSKHAEPQQVVTPAARFYAAPGAADNPACQEIQPCSPQGAAMACNAQPIHHVRLFFPTVFT
jgi:hypothetical protein